MKTVRVAVAQLNLIVGDVISNTLRIIEETQRIQLEKKADLILFPELSICGYPPEDLLFRPGFISACDKALKEITQATQEVAIIIGYPERIDGKLYNRAAVIQHQKIIASYSKQVLPNFTVFDEKRYFEPGDSTCVFTLNDTKMGLLICEDIWHKKPAADAAKAGAQLLLVSNASPYNREQVKARQNTLSERAVETGTPIIYANNIGGQDELVFDGGSMVIDKTGQRCQQAPYYQEDMMIVRVHNKDNNTPVAIEARPLPKRLTEMQNIYQTLTLAIHDYIKKNHFPGAIVGLSGGIDSALTLALASDALGPKNVIAVLMPSDYTADMSIEDAKKQALALGVRYETLPITTLFTTFKQTLAPVFQEQPADIAEQNLQARIRGTLLMALSNKFGHIVLTTSNKSETAVGYATLYGDMAGGFAALKDVPKHMVYELAKYRNSISPVIPERVITRAPSAELAPNQVDQDNLPPYDILDEILARYIEKDESPQMLYDAGYDKAIVDKVIRLINRNEYKRRQAPIGVRLTQRAFGKDRRYPVTSGFVK